ncbi:repressor CpxP [Vibrio mimicus]|uniref:CpxP family protein n=1 Tax=Vibrio mimicus TaxID=674 RepID=UPI0002B94F22|nr:CpxP family protein [Vibrio mimicus]EMB50251.1 putative periplasmic protein cpxP [Vibrio mimicus CAIM 602]MBY7675169.1 CpxP family protein [Vibrio mimicus]MBY7727153.1 CpxP family protein [Vibrio mimicus]TXY32657.1 CpxP family protein [Vibrio mimicus]SUP13576.1 repressor CpxP [Vibrio mimicus]
MKLAKKMTLAAAILPLTLGTTAAFAYGGHGWDKEGDGPCGGHGERGIWKQLDLTAEQQTQLKEMRDANREEMRANRGQNRDVMKALHTQERALVLSADFDQAAAENLAKQMVDQQVAHRVNMMEKHHQMMSILTAEQKTKLQSLQQAKMDQCMMDGEHGKGKPRHQ